MGRIAKHDVLMREGFWPRTADRRAYQGGTGMKSFKRTFVLAGALAASLAGGAASAAQNKVVIGDIDDMSGPYADIIGAGGVEAIKMAIADFGGTALGQPIEILTFDHQNKPDLGAQKLREWADTDRMTMLLGGSNSGVSLAM